MGLSGISAETVRVSTEGSYLTSGGRCVVIQDAVLRSVSGTRLYRPDDFPLEVATAAGTGALRIEVTGETTGRAAHRLVADEGIPHVAALNFASAKNPGGGFLGNAKAQEEDLCRCSALYQTLLTQPRYYAENRRHKSLLYTDHIIYSPDVVFFRDDRLAFLDQPFVVSVITAPAPNAGEVLMHGRKGSEEISRTLQTRARYVLQVAADQGHRTLVLGAWGCGVFRNDPAAVAAAFAAALDELHGAFDRVVFAVYERGGSGPNLDAFRQAFDAARPSAASSPG